MRQVPIEEHQRRISEGLRRSWARRKGLLKDDPMKVFLVILNHERGQDIEGRSTKEAADKLAEAKMTATLDDLEHKIGGDDEGDDSLAQLKVFIRDGQTEQAMTLYGTLYKYYFRCKEEQNTICIREIEVE